MSKQISDERLQGIYALSIILVGGHPVLMAKRNRIVKQDKKVEITPTQRKMLKRELNKRMKIRLRRLEERRKHYYK